MEKVSVGLNSRQRSRRHVLQLFGNIRARKFDLGAFRFPNVRELSKQLAEAGTAVTRIGREIGTTEKRLEFGREPNRHGPSTAAGGGLHEEHVDTVDIGALFAVHLDGNEVAVQQFRDAFVFERFVRHDMAPVASGVTDGKEDGFIFEAGFVKSGLAPGQPIHRIMGVLPKVGAFLVDERVGEAGRRSHLLLRRGTGHHFALRMSGGGGGGEGHQFVDVLAQIGIFGHGVPLRAAIGRV